MNKEEIESILRDYNWMIKEINSQHAIVSNGVETRMVAKSGIESTLPRARGGVSDPVAKEVIRRERKYAWITKLEQKVIYIQERLSAIDDPEEIAVLECILDGMTITAISKHMGLSRKRIYNIKRSIIYKLSQFTQTPEHM
ncbi:helix-turn-helix transcriptional regulator [Virgibacillus salexigens]|uniref:helix-turn-helix transcriptional regulator n=1 Tax=Virgibacillus salexigens TaxID=61016 RepID=UPI00190C9E22|nr:helix-turn-helix domain-containing protein [Virgibacillus salexigens]